MRFEDNHIRPVWTHPDNAAAKDSKPARSWDHPISGADEYQPSLKPDSQKTTQPTLLQEADGQEEDIAPIRIPAAQQKFQILPDASSVRMTAPRKTKKTPLWLNPWAALIAGLVVANGSLLAHLWFSNLLEPAQTTPMEGELTLELGEPLTLDGPSLLKAAGLEVQEDADYQVQSELKSNSSTYNLNTASQEVTTKGKSYLDCGTYTLDVLQGEETQHITVTVEDTIAPEFVDSANEIAIEQGATFSAASYWIARDVDEVSLQADSDALDTSQPGTYPVQLKAQDRSGNTSTRTVQVNVLSDEQIAAGAPISQTADGSIILSDEGIRKAKSGDLYITSTPPESALAAAIIQSRGVASTLQYSFNQPTGSHVFHPDDFVTSPYGTMQALGLDYKSFREFVNTGKSYTQYRKDEKVKKAIAQIHNPEPETDATQKLANVYDSSTSETTETPSASENKIWASTEDE